MPTIKISVAARDQIAGNNGLGSGATLTNIPGFGHTEARIFIMKGTLPSQAELDDLAPTWSRIQGGSPTDILIEMPVIIAQVNAKDGNFWYNQQHVVATQSGVASWWCWTGSPNYNPVHRKTHGSPPINEYLACIAGTISTLEGSPIGDLVMSDINIVAGNEYQIGPIEIEVPEVITW